RFGSVARTAGGRLCAPASMADRSRSQSAVCATCSVVACSSRSIARAASHAASSPQCFGEERGDGFAVEERLERGLGALGQAGGRGGGGGRRTKGGAGRRRRGG